MCIGYDSFRSKQAPFPFVRDITVDVIAAAGDKLWKELVGTDTSRSTPMKISNVQLSFSGIGSMEAGQRSIEGFFQKPPSTGPSVGADKEPVASDSPGNSSAGTKRKRAESLAKAATNAPVGKEEVDDSSPEPPAPAAATSPGFFCDRCGKRITLAEAAFGLQGAPDPILDAEMREAVDKLRREHDDFHFAQDLANDGSHGPGRAVIRPSEGTSQPPKKRKAEARSRGKPGSGTEQKGSIAKFFTPR